MKPRRFHGLKRPKIRQTWNKYNLYNLMRMRNPRIGTGDVETFFQQKWRAKGMLRAYHGEHVVERKWERMFSRRLLGVAEMDPAYMALHDGSELAAGRGSGKDERPAWGDERVSKRVLTPYMQMAFAPMERRLDIAVFRAMFASSARQARQLCVHGKVKVNGKVMPYPAYRLNPGDMFQVEPDMVMLATGQQKGPAGSENKKNKASSSSSSGEEEGEEAVVAEVEEEASESETAPPAATTTTTTTTTTEQDPDTTDVTEPTPSKADLAPTRRQIQDLVEHARDVLDENDLSVAQKRKLRAFIKQARPLLSRAGRASASATDIADELSSMMAGLKVSSSSSSSDSAGTSTEKGEAGEGETRQTAGDSIDELTKEERKALERLIREEEENPHDPSKPYLTPWRPRPYMSPFAFIPRYLEVNPNVCAAVYLRHPVARVGTAEVPTPYPNEINQLAFNWYLRRR
ncbi:hypothetical protein MGN70_005119 [Eutypa lata]|nr:hypothetical protein MGN70_005119 [Eutypa lata]